MNKLIGSIKTNKNTYKARYIINCSGLYSDKIAILSEEKIQSKKHVKTESKTKLGLVTPTPSARFNFRKATPPPLLRGHPALSLISVFLIYSIVIGGVGSLVFTRRGIGF